MDIPSFRAQADVQESVEGKNKDETNVQSVSSYISLSTGLFFIFIQVSYKISYPPYLIGVIFEVY